jgi:hypothetical protein
VKKKELTFTTKPHEESKSEGQPPHAKEVMLLICVLGTEVIFYYGDLMELAKSVVEGNPIPSGCKVSLFLALTCHQILFDRKQIHQLSHSDNRPFDLQVSVDLQAVVKILDKMKHFLSSS